MKRVIYAGTEFITTDSVASELLQLAEELANHGRANTVVVPGLRVEGEVDEFSIVLGPSSQIVVNTDVDGLTLDTDGVAEQLRDRRLRLVNPPEAQSAQDEGDRSDAVDEY